MIERLWVRILAELDRHDIFCIDLLQNLYCLLTKTENKRIRGRGWPFFKKNSRNKRPGTALLNKPCCAFRLATGEKVAAASASTRTRSRPSFSPLHPDQSCRTS